MKQILLSEDLVNKLSEELDNIYDDSGILIKGANIKGLIEKYSTIINQQYIKDIHFLLSFVKDFDKGLKKGLIPMMYITGSYENDKRLSDRIKQIKNRIVNNIIMED